MRRLLVAMMTWMTLAAPAGAATYLVTLEGVLTSQHSPGTDANLAVGDVFHLTAKFDERNVSHHSGFMVFSPWGDGMNAVGGFPGEHSPLPISGARYFRINGGGLTWRATDDENDGIDGNPLVYFTPAGVLAVDARAMYPADFGSRPILSSGRTGDPSLFTITAPGGLYGNDYQTPGFDGAWDFAGSTVEIWGIPGVPEPASWATMIAGFGLMGAMLRRRRRVAEHAISCA